MNDTLPEIPLSAPSNLGNVGLVNVPTIRIADINRYSCKKLYTHELKVFNRIELIVVLPFTVDHITTARPICNQRKNIE